MCFVLVVKEECCQRRRTRGLRVEERRRKHYLAQLHHQNINSTQEYLYHRLCTCKGNEAEEDVFRFVRWDQEHVHKLADGVDVEGSSDAER